jgi:hypothetical protein
MDAVYAWDQQDIYFYVPGGDDHFNYQGIFYQTSLRGARPEGPKVSAAIGGCGHDRATIIGASDRSARQG